MKQIANNKAVLAFAMVFIIFGLGAILIDGYVSMFALRAMLVIASFLIIAATGQTLVMLIGGIDLSIPFVIGFANVTVAQLSTNDLPFWLCMLIVVAICMLFGALNGGLSSVLRVHPLIITLGSGTALLGAALLWTKGYPTGSAPQYINEFVSIGGSVGPIPVPMVVITTIGLVLFIAIFERRSLLGRRIFALGSNPSAASYVHINKHWIWVFTFAVSAGLAAVTGILLLGFSGAAFADVGRIYMFQTIAAAVIGGTALSGGAGGIVGTVAGALALTQINTVLIGLGLDQSIVQVSLGVLIVAVVAAFGRQAHLRTEI